MKKIFTLLLASAVATILSANNISVTNMQLTGQNTTDHYTLVQFDISWENAWRTSAAPYNRDAAWVFIKYRVTASNGGDGLWKHAGLNNTGHNIPSGCTFEVGITDPASAFNATTNPGIGGYLCRTADGSGAFANSGVQLRWNYGANGLGDNAVVEIQVFALEMVYVPQGAFTLGTGGVESGSFTNGSWTSGATVPLSVASQSALTIDHSAGNLWGTSSAGTNTIGPAGSLGASFPKGFHAFYCMKYEISQQGYVDFLNTLTYTQQQARTAISPGSAQGTYLHNSARNKIKIGTPGTATAVPAIYTTDNPYVACNFISWADLTAYLDWSGLRPMSELEFEKASRGTLATVPNEYAWGTAGVAASAYTYNNTGANNEMIATNYSAAEGNASCSATIGLLGGPMRTGIFAGSAGNTGRITSGAGFYGVMEMSGNLWERIVTVGNSTGRSFTGVNGNGSLNAAGNSDVSLWPGTDATGSGFRGGNWGLWQALMQVSDRYMATHTDNARYDSWGGRGVRGEFSFYIGQSYGGGIIFYLDNTGQHGLIAAASDQGYPNPGTIVTWGCRPQSIPGTLAAIGTGAANTALIVANGCNNPSYAARVCNDLVLNGYSDWFLPSKDELNQMYVRRTLIGGFANSYYWCSTEMDANYAFIQHCGAAGTQTYTYKDNYWRVRAIRAF